jgi:hypothetical protein
MWIFTSKGFFSIVENKFNPDLLHVRARVREDFLNFLDLLPGDKDTYPIEETPNADYGFRLDAPKEEVVKVIQQLTADIDYTNFKSSIHGDSIRDAAYMQLWAVMKGLQNAKAHEERLKNAGPKE